MGKNSRRKVKDDHEARKNTVRDPQEALGLMVEDVHRVVREAPDNLFGTFEGHTREDMMKKIDEQLAKFLQVIQNQRDSINRLMAEREALTGWRLVGSCLLDNLVAAEDPDNEGVAHGELVYKFTEAELTGTKPEHYEMSIEDHESTGRRYYCIRGNRPEGGPDPATVSDV